jgi:hypothetical protein
MAIYKVPQDVEAEDKLLGPFSFRQFIYLIITAASLGIGFLLFKISPILLVIPLPVAIVFGVLALPLRKDQPMETYVLAIVRFYLKPRMRLWNPSGTVSYVTVVAPQVIERHLTKDFDQQTAQQRLDYLANIMDSRGWSVKGLSRSNNSINPDAAAEVADVDDIMDNQNQLSKSLSNMLAQRSEARKQQAMQSMQNVA